LITRQGHLRRFDEAIAQFVDGNFNPHFCQGFYGAQAVGASASHEISHMRKRYSALSVARGRTCSHGDWNPSGKCHDLLHEGVTLTKWRSVKVLLTWSADVAEAAGLY